MSLATLSAEQVVNLPFPSYHKPLELARLWTRRGTEDGRLEAVALLGGLITKYPHVLTIGQELVLALMESGRLDEAERVLRQIEAQFLNLDEETLCRWGRLYKNHGDRYVRLPWSPPDAPPADSSAALPFYRKSLRKYNEAYQIRSGHYPGINKATLLLIIGTLAPVSGGPTALGPELVESADLARRLLENRADWPDDHADDIDVWHPATAAEAHLLLREWEPAARQYRVALSAPHLSPRCRDSMWRQAVRILGCFHSLGVTEADAFPLDQVFPGMPQWNAFGDSVSAEQPAP